MIRELPVTELDLSRGATIWDVRDAKSFAEGHLKGAVNRPIDGLSAELLASVPVGEPVYVLCGGGTKARARRRCWMALMRHGMSRC